MLQAYRFLPVAIAVLALAVTGPSFAQKVQGYVQEVSGTVTAQVGSGRVVDVAKGQTIVNNAMITTGPKSYAVLKFEDGTSILLKEMTSIQIQGYSYDAKAPQSANATVQLLRGGIRISGGQMTSQKRHALKVATPMATMGIRSSEFVAVLVNPLYLQVMSGTTTLTNSAGTVAIGAGQTAVVSNAKTLGALVPINEVPAGTFEMPNVLLTQAPATIPAGPAVGGAAGGVGVGTALAIGAAVVGAGLLISADDDAATVTHH
jgi:hypothetical protein